MVNVLDERNSFKVEGSRTPAMVVPATSAKIFVAETQLRPLDPVVTRISPEHDATEISRSARIVIHFSEPMNTASVEGAFSTTPAVKGAFSWNAKHDEMTFTPEREGFADQSMVHVRLGNTARGTLAGRTFHAAFESRFCCGISNVQAKEQNRTNTNYGNKDDHWLPKTKPVRF